MSYILTACVLAPRVCAKLFQSCPTLCNPMNCSLPDSSVHRVLRTRMGCHALHSGIFLTQRLNLCLLHWQDSLVAQTVKRLPTMWETRFEPWVGKIPWRRKWQSPFQYSCLENSMDGGAWWATAHGVAKSRTWLSYFKTINFTFVSNAYRTFSQINYILGHESNLGKFKKNEIFPNIFSDQNVVRLDINYRKKSY